MTTWFTADTHFGHKNIIKYAHRPFTTIGEHDETLIKNWNDCVLKGDTVYHLGDFAFSRKTEDISKLVLQLNGSIHLIYGNHDDKQVKRAKGFAWQGDMKYVRVEGQRIMLCHYAMRVWRASYKGSWMLYGHSHATLEPKVYGMSEDVGVDNWWYGPVAFHTLVDLMSKREPELADYHGKEK